ncbi:MAG: tRNA dihydrouridine synthase DusB [Bacteroidetes bacterium]|nr:MAG: tRNA dihydrouridine synthase DusB [Bacteroidota bacterium]
MKIGNVVIPDFPLILAPMEDVSDPPFRFVCKQKGADIVITEFISSEGLIRDAIKSKKKLEIFEYERPVGIQIFGGDEEALSMAAKIVEAVQPDFLDINFGCPVKKVVCRGAGAGVLKDLNLMEKLTRAVVKSVQIPVTVKTRLGWDENSINIEEAALRLQDAGIQALSIHARTRSQMYKGTANWEYILKVKENPNIQIPIFGNGDIDSPEKAKVYKEKYHPDGIMIGRASIGYPWIFNEIKHYLQTGKILPPPSLSERIEVCKTHLLKSIEWKGERLGILEMRRHYANYFKGIPNFKPIRTKLVTTDDLNEILDTLNSIPEILSKLQQSYHSSVILEDDEPMDTLENCCDV